MSKAFIDFDKIANQKELTTEEYRRGYQKLKKLRSGIAKESYAIRNLKGAKGVKDKAEIYKLNKSINKKKSDYNSVKNIVKGKTTFDFENKKVTVKNSTIKKSKNPAKYVFGLYERSTKKQIDKLEEGDYKKKWITSKLKGVREAMNLDEEEDKEEEDEQEYYEEEDEQDETPLIVLVQEKKGSVKISNLKSTK